ncbi:predicted protein [Naegleria gruberi]|uniref:Predicted protein n=1 Tax=Naegleria gruberi TaxID=5762 RepID=D2VZS8_NAEGR|nr:uncharacterized protein NAEGRDRAFT_74603 [Naegleria gruberi]EFC37752.1 predicted protein [Naegleria gruberi]|eukprot:XP_002670496.1 predicted protein [Naegleria gruberi strain NEG-M]
MSSLHFVQFDPNQTKTKRGKKRKASLPTPATISSSQQFQFHPPTQTSQTITSSSTVDQQIQVVQPLKKAKPLPWKDGLKASDNQSFTKLIANLEHTNCTVKLLEELKFKSDFLKAFIISCSKYSSTSLSYSGNKTALLTTILEHKSTILSHKDELKSFLDKDSFVKANLMTRNQLTSTPSFGTNVCLGIELDKQLVHIANGYTMTGCDESGKVRVVITSLVPDCNKYYSDELLPNQIEDWNLSCMSVNYEAATNRMTFTQFQNKFQNESDEVDNSVIFENKVTTSIVPHLSSSSSNVNPSMLNNSTTPKDVTCPQPLISQQTNNREQPIFSTGSVGSTGSAGSAGSAGSSSSSSSSSSSITVGDNISGSSFVDENQVSFLGLMNNPETSQSFNQPMFNSQPMFVNSYLLQQLAEKDAEIKQLQVELKAEKKIHKLFYKLFTNYVDKVKKEYKIISQPAEIRLAGRRVLFTSEQMGFLAKTRQPGVAIRFICKQFNITRVKNAWKEDFEHILDHYCFKVVKTDDQWENFRDNQKRDVQQVGTADDEFDIIPLLK